MSDDTRALLSADLGHERRDISLFPIVMFFVGLEIFLIGCCAVGYGLHRAYQYWNKPKPAMMSPLAQMDRMPPAPRLQVDPGAEMAQYRDAVHKATSEPARWLNAEAGQVALPIEDAKRLVLEEGLPARSGGSK